MASYTFIFLLLLGTTDAISLRRQNQLVFPPSNGPCNQNQGLQPLQCTDPQCLDVPAAGICHIMTQSGMPLCGCCDSTVKISCSACGGDAGGGICNGTDPTGTAYQGCPCSLQGGEIPNGDQYKVCPEDNGSKTQTCASCGGDTIRDGICDRRTELGGGLYRFCSCCPESIIACADCGGDKGDGHCKGVEQYSGFQHQNCACDPNKSDHPVIVPFPIPPVGYPIPPPGTPNPKVPCQDSINVECQDCDGMKGWCQHGDNVGCPCREEDDQNCPDGIDVPDCPDANCGGATNSSIVSTCRGMPDGKNKDCPCFQYREDSPPFAPFSEQELRDQQAFLGQLLEAATSTAPPTPTATGKLTCSGNTVKSIPGQMVGASGNVTPSQLLYALREVICTNSCKKPENLPEGVSWSTGSKNSDDCEVSVAIAGGSEAWFYRGTQAVGDQWQQCWDSTESIIKQCVKDGPNQGWVNGPSDYQFYQGGFRPLNGEGSIHSPMSDNGLRSTIAIGSVSPTNLKGITCNSGTGGTRLADCFQILGSIVFGEVFNDKDTTEKYCTGSTCITSGDTGSSDGKTTYGSFCEIARANGCSVVLATKLSSLGGFPGKSCVSPAEISTFIRMGANSCGANQATGVWAAGFKNEAVAGYPYTVLGLVDSSDPGVVFVP